MFLYWTWLYWNVVLSFFQLSYLKMRDGKHWECLFKIMHISLRPGQNSITRIIVKFISLDVSFHTLIVHVNIDFMANYIWFYRFTFCFLFIRHRTVGFICYKMRAESVIAHKKVLTAEKPWFVMFFPGSSLQRIRSHVSGKGTEIWLCQRGWGTEARADLVCVKHLSCGRLKSFGKVLGQIFSKVYEP